MNGDAQILPGVWRLTANHPEWSPDEDWDPEVAWWAVQADAGLVLIDPLVADWDALDALLADNGGCAAIVRTCFWHERSIAEVHSRYGAGVWARTPPANVGSAPFDHPADADDALPERLRAVPVSRDDELAVWLPEQRALVFGDAMLRDREGSLSMCPESWLERDGGRAGLRRMLAPLLDLGAEHVLVSHGPLVLGDAPEAFPRALADRAG